MSAAYAKNCKSARRPLGINYQIYPTGKRIQSFNMGYALYKGRVTLLA